MDDFLFALNTVLPLLTLMAAGWFCRRIGLLKEQLVKDVNQLVFRVFLPVNLCYSVMNTPYDTPISGLAFLLIPGLLIVQYALLFFFVPRIEKDRRKVGVMIQAMGRANYAFFGIPLVAMLFPGQDTSLAALLVTVTVPIYNCMSVIALCVWGDKRIKPSLIVLNILKNPLIISSVLGFALWMARFQPPVFLKTAMNDLSKIATPLALFTLGGAIRFVSAKAHVKQLTIVVPWKLFLSPLIFMAVCVLAGMRGIALACAYIAFGAPVAVSSYPMAQSMGADGELAAECVAFTSTLCILSTFVFVFAMKSTGLI